jgi:septum formation protein
MILASASPRRKELLQEHGYRVQVKPAQIEEVIPAHLTVGEVTLFNAKLKAEFIAADEPRELVLGADTLVAFEGQILGKPANMDEAYQMLSMLAGQTHEVFSGVWLCRNFQDKHGRKSRGFIETSRVTFRSMSPEEVHEYLSRVGPLDKAGAYAAQSNELDLIQSIQGSWTNVVGLPMEALDRALRNFDL